METILEIIGALCFLPLGVPCSEKGLVKLLPRLAS